MLVLGLLLAMGAVVPSATAATVRYWNSQSNPLIASDSGAKKAAGYGKWTIGTTSNGTRSQAWGYLKDLDANGKNVYFELFTQTNAGYCLQPDYTSCNAKYYEWNSAFSDFNKETWNRNYWSPEFYTSTNLNPSGNYARARMQVSESNSGPDTHSGDSFTKGNAY